jgi:osmotically-inducible protein OsmY
VTARDGEVTLTGRVSSWEEHDGAVAAAHAAPGVRSVNDQLVVRAGS